MTELKMYTAQFISVEDEEPDLLLAFVLDDERLGVKSLILHRTPPFEVLLDEHERGVQASMEGDDEYEDNLLETVEIEKDVVRITALRGEYAVDISKIGKKRTAQSGKNAAQD